MAHAVEQIVLSSNCGKLDAWKDDYILQKISQGLLNTTISQQDVVYVDKNGASVHHNRKAYSAVMHSVYQVSYMYPQDGGVITGDTAIILGHRKGQKSFTKESLMRQFLMRSRVQLDSLTQKFSENIMLKKTDVKIDACPALLGYDSVVFLPKEIMKRCGIESGQAVMTKNRLLYVANASLALMLSKNGNPESLRQFDKSNNVGLVSPTLHFNMGNPREISLTLDCRESLDRMMMPTEVVLYPLVKWDLYGSSVLLGAEESIEEYAHRQCECASWVKGDIVAIPITPKSAQAKFELAFARSRDLIEHKHVDSFGGRYLFFRVGNSGTREAKLIMGSAISHEDHQEESTRDLAASESESRTRLPSIPAPHIIAMSPGYNEIKKIVQRLSLGSESNHGDARSLAKGNLYDDTMSLSTLPGNCAVIQEAEGNFALESILAAVREHGFRQPVLLRADALHCEDIYKAAKIFSKDRMNAVVLSITSCFDPHSSKFFDGLSLVVSRLPKDMITIVHLTIEPPLSFINRFPYFLRVENPSKKERVALIAAIRDFVSINFEISTQLTQMTNHMNCGDLFHIFAGFPRGSSPTQDILQERVEQHALSIGVQTSKSKIVSVKWDDVGGLIEQKDEILTRLALPLKFKENRNLRTSGILLYGPPGCGKTLLAKAVANEFNIGFLNVKGPELLNMYVGQSEKNVRETFRRAKAMEPVILFFDEIDALAPSRSSQGEVSGVMSRVVSQLASEIDDLHSGDIPSRVFVFAATNRIDLIDKCLLRPGRFDFSCYIGPPKSRNEIVDMLGTQLRKIQLDADVCLDRLVDILPSGAQLTGADTSGIVSNALLKSFNESGNFALKQKHLIEALSDVLETSELPV